jgi:hypothetical protein
MGSRRDRSSQVAAALCRCPVGRPGGAWSLEDPAERASGL